jgi:hypothetical protein
LLFGALVGFLIAYTPKADAKGIVPFPVCGKGEHIGNPHCITPTPLPTETPTETPTPTTTPEPTITPTVEPTQPITPTPDEPLALMRASNSGSTEGGSTSTPLCQDTVPYKVSDFWIENPVSGDNALTLHWGTSGDWDKVNIAYGENKYEWKYALLGTEDDGEEVIGGLKNGQHYWFQIAYVNGCSVSEYSEPIDPLP